MTLNQGPGHKDKYQNAEFNSFFHYTKVGANVCISVCMPVLKLFDAISETTVISPDKSHSKVAL